MARAFSWGKRVCLAHDNSPVNATPSPFDAVPELEKPAKAQSRLTVTARDRARF